MQLTPVAHNYPSGNETITDTGHRFIMLELAKGGLDRTQKLKTLLW